MSAKKKNPHPFGKDKQVEFLDRVRSKKLPITEANAKKVKALLVDIWPWEYFFKKSFLGTLPDPGGLYTDGPKVLEDWLVEAYSANSSRRECRAAIRSVRKQVLKEVK